jgi:hypothetical protein
MVSGEVSDRDHLARVRAARAQLEHYILAQFWQTIIDFATRLRRQFYLMTIDVRAPCLKDSMARVLQTLSRLPFHN